MSSPEEEFERIEAEEAKKEQYEDTRTNQKQVYSVNLDSLTPQVHRWVDRGAVMSCEGAGHASPRVFTIPK